MTAPIDREASRIAAERFVDGEITLAEFEDVQAQIRAQRNPKKLTGWRRITSATACDFCVMLASRGAVYRTADSADFEAHTANDKGQGGTCQCTIEPVWDHSPDPPEIVSLRNEFVRVTLPFVGNRAKIAAWRQHWRTRDQLRVGAVDRDLPPATTGRTGQAALDAAVNVEDVPSALRAAGAPEHQVLTAELELRRYQGSRFANLNEHLYGMPQGEIARMQAKQTLEGIDPVFKRARLADNVVVYRGSKTGLLRDLGDDTGDLTGREWVSPAFQSTSANKRIADGFARGAREDGHPTVMTISAPKGTPAVSLSRRFDSGDPNNVSEAEIVLGRDLRYRVTKDNGVGSDGVRRLDVEIVPVKVAAPAAADVSKLTVPQLRTLARDRGVSIPVGAKKADIVRLLDEGAAPSPVLAKRGADLLDDMGTARFGSWLTRRRDELGAEGRHDSHFSGRAFSIDAVAKRQGFDARPIVASADELDRLVDGGAKPIYRGLASDMEADGRSAAFYANEFRNGEAHWSAGTNGSGVYFIESRTAAEAYASQSPDSVLRAVLHPDAKVITRAEVDAMIKEAKRKAAADGIEWPEFLSDEGVFAAAKGFDAMTARARSGLTTVVLNRSAVIVERSPLDAAKAAAPAAADVSKLTVPQLRTLARERGVTIPVGAKKADIVRLLDEGPPSAPGIAARAQAAGQPVPDWAGRPAPPMGDGPLALAQAVRDLELRPGQYVSLAEIRAHPAMARLTRAEQDEAIGEAHGVRGISLISWDNRKQITDRDRAAAWPEPSKPTGPLGPRNVDAVRIEFEMPPSAPATPAKAAKAVKAVAPKVPPQTVAQLKATATERGIPIPPKATKAQLVKLLESTPDDVAKLQRSAQLQAAQLVESGRGTARLLAEVDELISQAADKATIRQRLNVALTEPGQVFAGADQAVLKSLRDALTTGDATALRTAVTKASTKAKVKPIGRAGQKTRFDPDTMDGPGVPKGAQVVVVRRGSTLTLPDGKVIQLEKARVQVVTKPAPTVPTQGTPFARPGVDALPVAPRPPAAATAAKATNPKFGNTTSGPTYRAAGKAKQRYDPSMGPLPSGAFEENCTNVVMAFEMRMRGYRVTARPTVGLDRYGHAAGLTDSQFDQLLLAWRAPGGLPHGRTFKGQSWITTEELTEVVAKWPEGGRGLIHAGRHTFNVVKKNGRMQFIEAQSAGLSGSVTPKYLKKYGGPGGRWKVVRLDDLEPSDAILEAVEAGS